MNLYEISEEYSKAFNELSEMDLDDETINDSLALIKDSFESKAIACVSYEKGLNGQIDTITGEIKRLNGMKSALKAKQDRFREYIRSNMESSGIDKISCDLFTMTLRKPLKVVDIFDADLIPEEYLTKPSPQPMKADIKKAIQNGEFVDGALLIDGIRGLQIK